MKSWLGVALLAWFSAASAQEVAVARPQDPLEAPFPGSACFWIQDAPGVLGEEGWGDGSGMPICLPTPPAPSLVSVWDPFTETRYTLSLVPQFGGEGGERSYHLVVFGNLAPPLRRVPSSPRAFVEALLPAGYTPFPGGESNLPGLGGWAEIREVEGRPYLLLRLEGAPLRHLEVGELSLYRNGLRQPLEGILARATDADPPVAFGGIPLPQEAGLYEMRLSLLSEGKEVGYVRYVFARGKDAR